MRITCPNCGAQYEIDPRVIPDIGRDVQCSNCGHTWFQRPPSAVAASVRRVVEDPPVTPADPEPAESARKAPATVNRAAEAFPQIADEPELVGQAERSSDTARVSPDPEEIAPPPVPSRPWAEPVSDPIAEAAGTSGDWGTPEPTDTRADASSPLDDQMLSVLREEADREARARAAEARPVVELQSDLGLQDETDSRPRQRTANLHSTEADQDSHGSSAVAVAMAAAANRREKLPDVDSITSGLRTKTASRDDRADEDSAAPDDDVPARGGFRTGFLLTLLLVIVALLVYRYAPALADAVPSLRAPLAGYVEAINGLRVWIDGLLTGATAQLNSLSE